MTRAPRPDLASLIGMIGEGRIAELSDLELVARIEKKIQSTLARVWGEPEP